MLRIQNYLFVFLICFATSSFAQYEKYVVKVKLDTDKKVRGKLLKASSEGIILEDSKGNSHHFSPQNINKIKVKRKGLTFLGGLGIGAGVGFFTAHQVFKDVHSISERIIGSFLIVSTGIVAGSITGLVTETINTKATLNINSDIKEYEKSYFKLEKYANVYNAE